MQAFPTVGSLAAATDAEALRVWERAGYPRRALYLRRSAQIIVEDHDSQVPCRESELLKLPGVGPFSAAIVRCFGFGIDSTAVDTNVVRLFGRLLFGDLQPARETRAADINWAATRLTPQGQALSWNPAVMDFGASVCTPQPKCQICPLAGLCVAQQRFAAGETARPVRAQSRFAGSDRQLRGMIMRVLREHDGPLQRERLVEWVHNTSGVDDRRVASALDSLVADGLAQIVEGIVVLGTE